MNYFGARFYDPVLGIWLSSDPARQFSNPYNEMGGDPINGVDPDGEFVVTALVVGAVAGAYFGGVATTGSFAWKGFDITEDWDEVLIGAAAGAAGGAAGAYVGGPAMIAGQSTGALGWGATAGMIASSTAGSGVSWAGNKLAGRHSDFSTNFGAFNVIWSSGRAGWVILVI